MPPKKFFRFCSLSVLGFAFLTAAFASWPVVLPECEADSGALTCSSVYNWIRIERDGPVVGLQRLDNGATASAINISEPRQLEIPYTRTIFGAALVSPNPRQILNIGLGAGAINRLIEPTFKTSVMTTAEVDPMMLDLAKTYTKFQTDGRNQVVIEDGRRYLGRSNQKWDWIVLDAYVRRSQVPQQFTTLEFYNLVISKLSDRGVFIDNLISGSRLFQSNVKTLESAFPQVVFFRVPPLGGNVIAMAVKYKEPALADEIKNSDFKGLPQLDGWGVDYQAIRQQLVLPKEMPVPDDIKVLTDDFAPVEILDTEPAE